MSMPPNAGHLSPTGQLVATEPDTNRYSAVPADLKNPTGDWYIFDRNVNPPRTIAICPGGAVDAQNVKTGLELLAELGGLIDEVIEAEG